MDIAIAFKLIGIDPSVYFDKLRSLTLKERVEEAKLMLKAIKNQTKILLKKHHPDLGGDPHKFKRVNELSEFLTHKTTEYLNNLEEKLKAQEENKNSRILITTK